MEHTWRIIPFSKWLITVVSKSPNWGCSPSKWPTLLFNGGYQLTTNWGDPPNIAHDPCMCSIIYPHLVDFYSQSRQIYRSSHGSYGYGKCRYYYGINELFQRHPDLVEILSRTAPVTLAEFFWCHFDSRLLYNYINGLENPYKWPKIY